MNISFATLLNTLLFSSIAILLLSHIISGINTVSKKSFYFLSFIAIMIILRLLLPVEIRLQNSVYITKIWPDIYYAFVRPITIGGNRETSLISILSILSITGSIVCIIKLLLSYFSIIHTINRCRTLNDDTANKLIIKINNELNQTAHFRLVCTTEVSTPFIFGLFKPTIVLPELELSENELYYILSHEISHYYHKDLWIRLGCELLHIIYWWNPLIYILRRQIIIFQERHIDSEITQSFDEIRKLDYLSCLIKIAKLQPVHEDRWIASFNSKAEIQNRIETLLNSTKEASTARQHRWVNVIATMALILFTLFLPNLIIFEADAGIPEDILENAFLINNTNSYLILNENGTYDVYVDDECIATVTQIFDESLPIFNSDGEIIKEKSK